MYTGTFINIEQIIIIFCKKIICHRLPGIQDTSVITEVMSAVQETKLT